MISADIYRSLAQRHPLERGWLLFSEVHDHRTGRRADALAIMSWSSQVHAVGYEIKTIRSDWLREVENSEKRSFLHRVCRHCYLVAPPGVVLPAEVPSGWGLIEPVGKKDPPTLRRKVAAPVRDVPNLPSWLVLLLRHTYDEAEAKTRTVEAVEKRVADALSGDAIAAIEKRERAVQKKEREIRLAEMDSRSLTRRAERTWAKVAEVAGVPFGQVETVGPSQIAAHMGCQAARRILGKAEQARQAIDSLVAAAKAVEENP